MKTKFPLLIAIASLSLALPALAQHRVVTSPVGRGTIATNNFHRPFCHSGGVRLSVGVGFPFFGGYYGGYPYYGGYYPYSGYGYGYYPYGGGYGGSYGYGGGYSYGGGGYGYGGGNYAQGASYYASRPVDGGGYRGSIVARVQERLAHSGYYAGSVDGVMGPRTRSAIRAYERRHGLPIDGAIDRRLLATMGLA